MFIHWLLGYHHDIEKETFPLYIMRVIRIKLGDSTVESTIFLLYIASSIWNLVLFLIKTQVVALKFITKFSLIKYLWN
jgi:hypothetical protein